MGTADQVRASILDRILARTLPRRKEHDVFAGYGDGTHCVCCDKPIVATQVQYDAEPHSHIGKSQQLPMHIDCYNVWAKASELISAAVMKNHLTDTAEKLEARKRVFLIAYNYELLATRATLLRSRGYETYSALGNEAAKTVLTATQQSYDLFVIGSAAPKGVQSEVAAWLSARYPRTRILALHSADRQQLDDLKYNANDNSPAIWLPMAAAAVMDAAVA